MYVKIKSLEIPQDGLMVNLKKVGQVKIFRMVFKNEFRYYAMFVSPLEKISSISWEDFKRIHDLHWEIEQYHRALKQVCNIERFQVRESQGIRTHIFCAIRGFVQLEFLRFQGQILNWYSWQRNLFSEVVRSFIIDNLAAQFLELNNRRENRLILKACHIDFVNVQVLACLRLDWRASTSAMPAAGYAYANTLRQPNIVMHITANLYSA